MCYIERKAEMCYIEPKVKCVILNQSRNNNNNNNITFILMKEV